MARVAVLFAGLWLAFALLHEYSWAAFGVDERIAWALLLPGIYLAGMVILRNE